MFTATPQITAPVLQLVPQPAPAAWLVFDLETGDAPEEAIQAALTGWKPPANIKDGEKIEARRQEAAEKIRERAALLDASPVLCVAIQTDATAVLFNGMDTEEHTVTGWEVMPCGDERGLLLKLRDWLDTNTGPQTLIGGHNIRGFDLPKLRSAYVRHRLCLPELLKPRLRDEPAPEVVDTMSLYKAFSMENRDNLFISLDTVADGLGIVRPKGVISGSDVPRLHAAGENAAILTYCAIDTATTAWAFLLMTGIGGGLQ